MARPRQPLLTPDRIVTAATELLDAEGWAAFSTRRLAERLGVRGPSLYNHFATKEELLDAVVDGILAQVDTSCFDRQDWRVALRTIGHSYRAVLAAHPNLVPALVQGPRRRPHQLAIANAVYGGLVAAGWPPARATYIGASLRYFVTGSALGSFAGGFADDPAVYAAEYPHLDQAHRLSGHRASVDDGAFAAGMDALVDGFALAYEREVGPLPPLSAERTGQP